MEVHAFRLTPGQDLKSSLVAYAKDAALEAGCIVTCVGSLSKVKIRLANCTKNKRNETVSLDERFEIVSLTGTLSRHGAHLHISIADFQGNVVGGHLLDGCEVFTTAEVVVGECGGAGLVFKREMDEKTGFDELVVVSSKPKPLKTTAAAAAAGQSEAATAGVTHERPQQQQQQQQQQGGKKENGSGGGGGGWFKRKDGRSWLAPPRPEDAGKSFDEYVDEAVNYMGQHSDWRAGKNRVNTFKNDLPASKDSLTKVQGPRQDWRAVAAATSRKKAEEEKEKAKNEDQPRSKGKGILGWLGNIIAPEPTPPSSPKPPVTVTVTAPAPGPHHQEVGGSAGTGSGADADAGAADGGGEEGSRGTITTTI